MASSSSSSADKVVDQQIAELDTLVEGYLNFRQCDDANKAFTAARKHLVAQKVFKRIKKPPSPPVLDRVLAAFDDGDYPLLLSLWETFIVQQALEYVPPELEESRRNAEFLCNLHCAIYPFRSEVMRKAGAPDVAAKVAARSMTIFKHFIETRGANLLFPSNDLHKFRSVYKIAFPPTHPKCKELFVQSWVPKVRAEVQSFLDKFLSTSPYDHLPALYKIFLTGTMKTTPLSYSGGGFALSSGTGSTFSPTMGQGPESNGDSDSSMTTAVYKEREEKLVRFSQAIVDITSDLLRVIEAGDPLDNEFLSNFKEKFDYFRNALAGVSSPSITNQQQPPTAAINNSERGEVGGGSKPKPIRQKIPKQPKTKVNVVAAADDEKDERPVAREIDASALKFDDIVADLHSKIHEVENFLVETVTVTPPLDTAPVSDDGSIRSVEPDKAVKLRYALTSSMQASLLACNLAHLIVRPDRDIQPKASRDAAVSGLVMCDILGIIGTGQNTQHHSSAFDESSKSAAPDPTPTSGPAASPGTAAGSSGLHSDPMNSSGVVQRGSRLRNEGVVGYLEALRCYLRKVGSPFQPIDSGDPSLDQAANTSSTKGETTSAGDDGAAQGQGVGPGQGGEEVIGIYEASLCLSESLFRLITALGSSMVGLRYLQNYGFDLTTHTVKLLAVLPSTFNLKKDGSVLLRNGSSGFATMGADSDAIAGGTTTAATAYSEALSALTISATATTAATVTSTTATATATVTTTSAFVVARSSTRLWCQLAVIILTSNRKNDGATFTPEDTPLDFLNQAQNERVQTLTVRHGGLEWLMQALSSLLTEILAAAFVSHPDVLSAAHGKTDSASIAAAALELDSAARLSVPNSRRPSMRASASALATGDSKGLDKVGGVGSFSIAAVGSSSSSGASSVPQELLTLLDVSLGLLFVSMRSIAVHRVLVSTAVVQEKTKTLLKTLFQLLLLPQLTKTQAENVLLLLNLLFKYEVKIRSIGRNLPELASLGRNIARGDLKWFPDTQPLTQLVITVASDAVEKPPPVVNPTSSSSTTTGLNGAEAEFEGDLCAVESDILGMVSSLQIFIADNALVTAFLNKPKTRQSFVAALKPAGGGGAGDYGTTRALNKVTAFSLTSYIDPTKVQALTSIPTPS